MLVQAAEMRMEMFASGLRVDWGCCGRKDWWIGVVMVMQRVAYFDKRNSKLLWIGASWIVGRGWILFVAERTIAAL